MLSTSSCFCFAGYELFQGFNLSDVDDTLETATDTFLDSLFNTKLETSQGTLVTQQNASKITNLHHQYNTNANFTTSISTTKSKTNWLMENTSESNTNNDLVASSTIIPAKFNCPEEERPSNIGPYEVPTQRDMVLFTRNMLLDMFNNYNRDAFYLLKDIRAATTATLGVEKKCKGDKMAYRQCVKHASRQCQQITKNLVKALENQKQEILNLTKLRICNLSEMTTDPIEILKSLAQQKVSLEFALPGFLRLLNECSSNCMQLPSASDYYKNKPTRHMTDQDLVIKHLLTRKNYLELIMDSRHKTIENSN